MLNPLYPESLLPPEVSPIIIDGQDGSGKGTVANIIAERCAEAGANVIKIAYPAYHLPWGKYIRAFLSGEPGAPKPSLRNKMLAYALNRIETVPAILSMVRGLETHGQQINLIFDRFVSSNVLTLAYDAVNRPNTDFLTRDLIEGYYQYMLDIDEPFLKLLGLENWSAWIPLLPPEETIKRMTGDSTRGGLDIHENAEVQQTAAGIYTTVAEIDPRINVFTQYVAQENRLMTPYEVADMIRPQTNQDEIDPANRGDIFELSAPLYSVAPNLVNELLDKYGTDELKKEYNPYYL